MIKKILPVILFIFLLSCEDKGYFIKCSECVSEEPKNIDLKIDITDNGAANQTLIVIYEGDIEDNVVYDSFSTTGPQTTAKVTLNKKYSFTATYSIGGSTYTAVDAITPKVILEKSECQDICYFVYDKTVDLRLKYSK